MKPLLPRRVAGQGEKGEITVSPDCQTVYVHDGHSHPGISLRDLPGHGLRRTDEMLVWRAAPKRIIAFGDSITQTNSYDGVPDPDQPRSEIWTVGYGYAEQSIFRSGKPYQFVRNAGIAGETTKQMLARIQKDVLDWNPDVVLFMGGTNDILAGQVDQAYTDTMNNIETCVVLMLQAGIDVILVTPPAKDGAPEEMRQAMRFYYMLADYYNLPLFDTFKVTVDATTGMYKAGISDDGTHPNPVGIDLIATEGAKVLAEPWKYANPVYLAAVSEANTNFRANLLANGSFALPPSPIDGTTFQFWTWGTDQATADYSAAAALPFAGKNFVYTKTGGDGAYAAYGAGATDFVEGDILVQSVHLKVSGLTVATAQGHSLGLAFDNGDNARLTNSWRYNQDYVLSQEIIVPPNPGNALPNIYVQDAGVYTLNNWTLWNKSAAERIWKPGQL